MLTKEEENKLCQSCGKCCKSYWIFTDVPEEVERFETLSNTYVEVIKIKEGLWKIMFKISCRHLKFKENGTVECLIYDMKRPQYCTDYPRNFLNDSQKEALNFEKNFCPLLKKILEKNA